jgi:hypothetical protein
MRGFSTPAQQGAQQDRGSFTIYGVCTVVTVGVESNSTDGVRFLPMQQPLVAVTVHTTVQTELQSLQRLETAGMMG